MKICNKCFTAKSISEYYPCRWAKDGYYNFCKRCKMDGNKRDAYRQHHLSKDMYDLLILKGCGICGKKESLVIDHDHACCPGTYSCGKCVRGLLCNRHNSGLGVFADCVEELASAITYLNASRLPCAY